MTSRRSPRGYMLSSRVYEPVYTVNNLYNDCIILQTVNNMFVYVSWVEFDIIYKLQ